MTLSRRGSIEFVGGDDNIRYIANYFKGRRVTMTARVYRFYEAACKRLGLDFSWAYMTPSSQEWERRYGP